MKRFMKRVANSSGFGFVILDETGMELYRIQGDSDKLKQRLYMTDRTGVIVSEILHGSFMLHFFSVRCRKGLYVLLPSVRECFSFTIYGSSYRFAGDLGTGRFSMYDVDKSTVLTQKKCWTAFGEGYELEVFRSEQEIFALSVAVCAAMYLTGAEEKTVLSG